MILNKELQETLDNARRALSSIEFAIMESVDDLPEKIAVGYLPRHIQALTTFSNTVSSLIK